MAPFWSKPELFDWLPAHSRATMARWRVEDLMELVQVTYATWLSSFVARRTIQRLEWGEIAVARATKVIVQSGIWGAFENNATLSRMQLD